MPPAEYNDKKFNRGLIRRYAGMKPRLMLYITAIENYILFYNTKRYQKRLRFMTPLEFHAAA